MDKPDQMSARKADHISLCLERDVAHRTSTLLDEVVLMHQSLPELAASEVSLEVRFVGRALPTPLMISGMTGGIERAGMLNKRLAAAAERHGLAFGVGSQRAMLRDRGALATYQVRDVAPTAFVCANIGAVQARACSDQELADLVGSIAADALCLHLNPAQELVQDGGDRDFRGCADTIARAVAALDVPVIVKETGAGMSLQALARLASTGVRAVDVSGAGGTTWTGVEALRGGPESRRVGEALWSWGIPTAASVVWAHRGGFGVIASGGLRDGVDAARALALGADLASAALPFLRAADEGVDALDAEVAVWLRTLRAALVLTGSRDVSALRAAPRLIGPRLQAWLG